jgi:S-adenosylmethionine synthetase
MPDTATDGASGRSFLFTSESVTEGHPDKMADQISDSVLDAVLAEDPEGRVACETLVTTGLVVVAGEITTETYVDIPRLVRSRIRDIGYDRAKYGFDADTCGVIVAIDEQSTDIAQGVDQSYEVQHDPGDDDPIDLIGAGDQGMMFGFACTETEELMPLPIMLAHRITKRLAEVRKADVLPYLRPDGKAQVTVRYEVDAHGRMQPVEIVRVLVSTQHRDGLDIEALVKPDVVEHVLHPILPADLFDEHRLHERDFVLVNPTGRFVAGGPISDTGVTGRKIIVDTYGGSARHGGGAFSGKDPTKVDRSAAYAARYVAKNVVAAGLAERCELQIAYAIGVAHPVSIQVDCHGTETVPTTRIEELVREHFDLRPGAIIRDLDLRRPIYAKTAAYGHFGRADHDFTWERTDKADDLRRAAGLEAQVTA